MAKDAEVKEVKEVKSIPESIPSTVRDPETGELCTSEAEFKKNKVKGK